MAEAEFSKSEMSRRNLSAFVSRPALALDTFLETSAWNDRVEKIIKQSQYGKAI